MPIERELKFVLRYSQDLAADLREAATAEKAPISGMVCAIGIDQGYLQKGSRVRKLSPVFLTGVPSAVAEHRHRFTYKQKLPTQPGDLEIECDIAEQDFDLAWSMAERKLYKVRVELPMGNFKFEIDHFFESSQHFLDGKPPYLVLCECEIPYAGTEFEFKHMALHPIVEKHLVLAIAEGDNRFSNRKLGDRDYVARVLGEVANAKA